MKLTGPLLLTALLASVTLNIYQFIRPEAVRPSTAGDDRSTAVIGTRVPAIRGEVPVLVTEQAIDVGSGDLQLLFEQGAYAEALRGLALLPAGEARALRDQWLSQCMHWLVERENLAMAGEFIQAGLQLDVGDLDFRQLLAEQFIVQGQLADAVDLLYALLGESEPRLQGVFASRLQVLFREEVGTLSQQKAWRPLVDFAERLLWHEPSHPPYILVHARALAKLENYSLARSGLLTILHDDYYGAQARELLEEIERKTLSQTQIELRREGTHHIVAATLNGRSAVELMIDTGASYSVLSQRYVNARSFNPPPEFVRRLKVNTAGGVVAADMYRFSSLQIDDFIVRDLELAIIPLDSVGGADGLLGMNFLRHFEFAIDQKYNLLTLKPSR